MKTIVFATNNKHKLEEVSDILKHRINILSLSDIGCIEDIPETGSTLNENALQKARYVKEKFGYDCFADDTGLEIEALNNAPGVYSARYAGPQRNATDNMRRVMEELAGETNRKAQFRTVIALISEEEEFLFEGKVPGHITETQSGSEGFGYDPIFCPDGYNETFAEMGTEAKNKISHRALAVQKLIAFWEK